MRDGISIAFFGHDSGDAAIRRRIKSLQDDGLRVEGFMMRRGEPGDTGWTNHDLGQTRDGAFVHRAMSVLSGTREAIKQRAALQNADLFYARNMDMLAVAVRAKRRLKLDVPIVYECLDVHRLLYRDDTIGKAFRAIERRLIRQCAALVVSSPAFLEHHFERYYPGQFRPILIENRLTHAFTGGERPVVADTGSEQPPLSALKLGWVGVLRCQRSLDLLCHAAMALGPKLEVHIHGIPAATEIPQFHAQIAGHDNIRFHGRYKSPEDLNQIYSHLDLVWSGDFMQAGYNSVWLLPNRIYEGGHYATPAICPADTQTGKWVSDRQCGFTLDEPLRQSLPKLLDDLHADRRQIAAFRRQLSTLPESTFVQPPGFLRSTLQDILSNHDDPQPSHSATQLRPV